MIARIRTPLSIICFTVNCSPFVINKSIKNVTIIASQAELQDMMEKNVAFKQEAARLLSQAKQEAYDSLKVKLRLAVKVIGDQRGYAFILNTDNDAVPYINNATGEDISAIVKDVINK